MKHAYLIIAHNNMSQLEKLIKLLDSESHDFYIHIDKRIKGIDIKKLCNVVSMSKIHVFQEYKVYWGGFSLVEVELYLLSKAYENKYEYYHIISGNDLPLKTNDELDAFFEKFNGYEFIDFDETKLKNDPEIARRTNIYHFLQNYRRISKKNYINSIFVFFERVLLLMQIVFHIDRTRNLDWKIKYGSQWVSISHLLVEEILKQKNKIKDVFKWTNCADELFVQTIAFNCGFKNKIFINAPEHVMNNMRFVDWNRGKNGSPYTFKSEDFSLLMQSDALFARKFSEDIDNDIILKIIKDLSGE